MADLSVLSVLHRVRRATPPAAAEEPDRGALAIDTCQRRVRIAAAPLAARAGWSYRRGAAAYAWLLEIACGLQSAVPGETHVFGQIKSAWRAFPADRPDARRLRPIMQALFADTKRIRAAFLQGIGRQSYGRLAKRLIEPAPQDRILVVGAGSMGREMVGVFRDQPLAVWARGEPADLDRDFIGYGPGTERRALGWADQVIFCTPPLAELDRHWAQAARTQPLKTVLHLGYRRVPAPWADQPGFRTLHDLFKLRRARGNVVSFSLGQARRACHQAAAARAARFAARQVAL
jgi:hypothetical protein